MYNSQYLNPCCTFLLDHEYFSYSYYVIEGVPNYSNQFDVPLNASSSVISGICYIMIYWTVYKSSAAFSSRSGEQQKAKRSRDIRYAIQFSLLLVFYTVVWSLFRILPSLLNVEWFILLPTMYTINCTSNAIIYLGFNSEVQINLVPGKLIGVLHYFGLARDDTSFNQGSVVSVTSQSRASVTPNYRIAMRFIPQRKHQPFRSIGLLPENSNATTK
ncbi:unnamed protein product [Caenorhabditis brenneri]